MVYIFEKNLRERDCYHLPRSLFYRSGQIIGRETSPISQQQRSLDTLMGSIHKTVSDERTLADEFNQPSGE